MPKGEKRRDASAHGIAHHVGAGDAEMIEQAAPILRHGRRAIKCRVIELLALPVTPIVVSDDAAAGLRKGPHPAGADPVLRHIGGEAVNEQDGITLPLVDEGNPHTA